MTKIQGSYYFTKELNDKLINYCTQNMRVKNTVIEIALQGFLLDDVAVDDMSYDEAKKKWNEVNDKIQQLRELERKLYEKLED